MLQEIRKIFPQLKEFDLNQWHVELKLPDKFFHGLAPSNDPESNRRLLAERLDQTEPVDSPDPGQRVDSVDPPRQ